MPSALLEPASPPGTHSIASPKLRGRIPYITYWSAEAVDLPRLVVHGDQLGSDYIGHRREKPSDRDAHRTLWRRNRNQPGRGKPQLGKVHPARQRRAVGGLLCSYCGRPTEPEATAAGYLYLLSKREYEIDPYGPIETAEPPVHVRCAREAVNLCPHLRGHYVAVRAKSRRLYGVYGQVLIPDGTGQPQHQGFCTVTYDDWRIRWIVAQSLVARLTAHVIVDLEAEAIRLAA